jgi:hypothetical protein
MKVNFAIFSRQKIIFCVIFPKIAKNALDFGKICSQNDGNDMNTCKKKKNDSLLA